MPRPELATAPGPQQPGALLGEQRETFLIVGAPRRPDGEDGPKAPRARARQRVPFDLVEHGASRFLRGEELSPRHPDRALTRRRATEERRARLDGKGEAPCPDLAAHHREQRA